MNEESASRIVEVRTVGVPVTDQDRALEFYVENFGFAKRLDVPFRGVDADEVLRWPGAPPMFAFRDQDGNGLEIVEGG
jgi:lactoylglutathione lyase